MNDDAMKSTLIGLLQAILIGLVVSPVEIGQAGLSRARCAPEVSTIVVCVDEAVTLTEQLAEEVAVRGSDPKPVLQPSRPISLSEPRRPWLLPDKTWQAMADSRLKPEVNFERGQPYLGVRFVLPFGS